MLLQPETDAFNAPAIQANLNTQALGQNLHILTEVPSTNKIGISLAKLGEPHGTAIIAEHQTEGKGRLGRSWVSLPNENIYCSIIIRIPNPQKILSWVPLVTSLALSKSIQTNTLVKLSLKWPNDLLVKNKKLGGILCETTSKGNSFDTIIVGFGVNVNSSIYKFPEDIQATTTSLFQEIGASCNRNTLLASMFNHLEIWYDRLTNDSIHEIHSIYTDACSTLGSEVCCFIKGKSRIHGMAIGIGKDGSLLIAPFDQQAKTPIEVRSADVTHIR